MTATFIGDVQVYWINHASIKLDGSKRVYIDPYSETLVKNYDKADIVISTHPHFDHFDPEAIKQLADKDTVLVAKNGCDIGIFDFEARLIDPGEHEKVGDVDIKAIHAYNDKRFRNPGEPFHPRGEGMGVIVEMDGLKFYHASDTDLIDEMKGLKEKEIDVAFLPIGGTYTMDLEEAVEAVKTIKPDKVIPIHYNMIDGTEANPNQFKRRVESETDTDVIVLDPDK